MKFIKLEKIGDNHIRITYKSSLRTKVRDAFTMPMSFWKWVDTGYYVSNDYFLDKFNKESKKGDIYIVNK
jgi:hypothetical protein